MPHERAARRGIQFVLSRVSAGIHRRGCSGDVVTAAKPGFLVAASAALLTTHRCGDCGRSSPLPIHIFRVPSFVPSGAQRHRLRFGENRLVIQMYGRSQSIEQDYRARVRDERARLERQPQRCAGRAAPQRCQQPAHGELEQPGDAIGEHGRHGPPRWSQAQRSRGARQSLTEACRILDGRVIGDEDRLASDGRRRGGQRATGADVRPGGVAYGRGTETKFD